MPDPTKQTVSASEVAALVGRSPYYTRWSLWQKFSRGIDIPREEDARMSWGKKLQPLILEEVAALGRYEKIVGNSANDYVRRGCLGATLDGAVFDPSRGSGAIETKCVFDYRIWMEKWGGGEFVPPEIELQLQTQLHVGDGDGPFKWGVVCAWVAGELTFFERQYDPEIGEQLQRDAEAFLDDVQMTNEPDPTGSVIEAPVYSRLWYPVRPAPQTVDNPQLWRDIKEYEDAKAKAKFFGKAEDELKAKLLAAARDFAFTRGPNCKIEIKRSLIAGGTHEREEHIRTTLKVAAWGEDPAPHKDAEIAA